MDEVVIVFAYPELATKELVYTSSAKVIDDWDIIVGEINYAAVAS